MDYRKQMPHLPEGENSSIKPQNTPNYPNYNTTIQYGQYQGTMRNYYISETRRLYSLARNLHLITKSVAENTVGAKVDINFVKLGIKYSLSKEHIEYISDKWWDSCDNMVTELEPNLFEFQKNIIDELCITGEIYIFFCRDKENKLTIQPILSEHIDPSINGTTQKGNRVYYGIEYDEFNRVVAYWYRKPNSINYNDVYRLEVSYTYRIALQNSQSMRGTPWFLNVDYLRSLWLGQYNMAVKGFKALSITGVIKTILRDHIVNDPKSNNITLGSMSMDLNPTLQKESGSTSESATIISVHEPTIFSGDTHQFLALRPNEDFDNFPASTIDKSSLEAKQYETYGLAASFGMPHFQLTGEHKGMSYSASKNAKLGSHQFNVSHTMPKIERFMNKVFKFWVLSNSDDPIISQLIVDGKVVKCDWLFPELVDPDPDKESKALERKIKIGITSPKMEHARKGQDYEVYNKAWIEDNNIFDFNNKKKQ